MSHTTLRHGRRAAAAGLIAVAALGLTACNGTKSGAAGSPAGSASASPADSGGTGGSGDGGNSGGTAGGATGAKTTSAGHGSHTGHGAHAGAGSAAGRCTTGGLQAGWGSEGGGIPDMKSDSQQTAVVWLKNTGKAGCTLEGFPGVQIKGTDGTTWDLRRSAAKPAPVTLKPGAHTQFTIALLPSTAKDDKKIEPGLVTVTPPNEKKSFTLKWPYGGAVLDQSGATHPGTFVNPVNG